MPKKTEKVTLELDPVEDVYPPKTDDQRSLEETLLAEGRANAVDQDPDYHRTHPTLDTSGPEHDPEVVAELRASAAAAEARKMKSAVKDVAAAIEEEQAEGV